MDGADLVRGRLSRLRAQWQAFTQREPARLLVWQADAAERSLVELFVEQEGDAETAQTPDLFLQLTSPFTDEATHGFTLAQELVAQYGEATEGTAADDAPCWVPERSVDDDDACALLGLLASFQLHHGDREQSGKLAVWLQADHVPDETAYVRWLLRLARCAPPELRVVVVVEEPESSFVALAVDEPERIVFARCALDVPVLLEALAAGPGDAAPEDRLRLLFVRLCGARESLAHARATAQEAAEIALGLGQPALAAAAKLLLAAACSQHEQPQQALQCYAEADRLAALQAQKDEAERGPEPLGAGGAKLQLMAKLGAGTTMLMAGAFEAAAEAYLGAAPLARTARDVGTEIDCHRLASLSLARAGLASLGWDVGMRGLRTALGLPDDARGSSAVLLLAAQLVQLTKDHRALHDREQPLREQLRRALGPDWQARQGDVTGAV